MNDKPEYTPPVIGISGSSADSKSVQSMIAMVRASGAIPVFLGNHAARDAAKDIHKIDALIVMGNNADIDPERYGQEKHPKTNPESATPEGKARADYEYILLQNALDAKMPILGICGGMQRLNVLCGGTLHQHVPDLVGNESHSNNAGEAAFVPVVPITIEEKSILGKLAGPVKAIYAPGYPQHMDDAIMGMENTFHHQSVAKVAEGFRTVATSDEYKATDGKTEKLVEAFEPDPNGKYAKQFILAVQWHPEFGASPLSGLLAVEMKNQAQKYAQENNRLHPMEQILAENYISSGKQPPMGIPVKEEKQEPTHPPQTPPASVLERLLKALHIK